MLKTRIFFYLGVLLIILFLLAILLPALQRPTGTPRYLPSMSNLKQIGMALLMYVEDHNGVFPENFKQIDSYLGTSSEYVFKYVFNSPLKPRDFNGPSYIYVNGHSFKDAKTKEKYIIVYENPEYLTGYDPQKIIVTYLDGYVDRVKKEDFLSTLKATYEHLGKPMPEIKFKEQVTVNDVK